MNKLNSLRQAAVKGYSAISNSLFKITIIVCFIIFLIIYYQSTLNQRYQYYNGNKDIVVFDTKKGEMYVFSIGDKEFENRWFRVSPFSESKAIPVKKVIPTPPEGLSGVGSVVPESDVVYDIVKPKNK
jgi:hypothetical protein